MVLHINEQRTRKCWAADCDAEVTTTSARSYCEPCRVKRRSATWGVTCEQCAGPFRSRRPNGPHFCGACRNQRRAASQRAAAARYHRINGDARRRAKCDGCGKRVWSRRPKGQPTRCWQCLNGSAPPDTRRQQTEDIAESKDGLRILSSLIERQPAPPEAVDAQCARYDEVARVVQVALDRMARRKRLDARQRRIWRDNWHMVPAHVVDAIVAGVEVAWRPSRGWAEEKRGFPVCWAAGEAPDA